jgi:hypothetical protein
MYVFCILQFMIWLTTLVVIGTDCTSCKSNYITITTAPPMCLVYIMNTTCACLYCFKYHGYCTIYYVSTICNQLHILNWSIQNTYISSTATWRSEEVCKRLSTCRWFSPGTSVSSISKTDHHEIAEMLLKVALNTIYKQANKHI